MKPVAIILLLLSTSALAGENSYQYAEIADRYKSAALAKSEIDSARMQGECLVGLKELNFKRTDKFDPVAEWTNYRTISLLEQYSPCEVLIMMEVAQSKLRVD